MANIKFSEFTTGSEVRVGDIVVGLRSGVNTQFSFPSDGIKDVHNQYLFKYATPGVGAVNYAVLTSSISGSPASLTVDGTDVNIDLIIDSKGTGDVQIPADLVGVLNFQCTNAQINNAILDSNGNEMVLLTAAASSVNYLTLTNAAAGSGPAIGVAGTDTNVDLNINAKGTGDVLFNGSDVICGDPGTEASGINIGGVTYDSALKVSDLGGANLAQFIVHRHSTTLQALIVGSLSNSDTAAHADVTNGQSIFTMLAAGWTGSHYDIFGAVDMSVDATGTVSPTSSPGRIRLQVTADGSNTLTTALTVSNTAIVTLANALPIGSGGTGNTSALTNGQLFVGNTGTVPSLATLTAGVGISITNGAGSITIDSLASGMAWSTDASGTIAAAVDNGYVCGNAGATTITLPATCAVGQVVAVEGLTSTSWILTAGGGQTIQIGAGVTSSGGTLTSAAATDNVSVLCIVANTTWRVQRTNSAGLTIA